MPASPLESAYGGQQALDMRDRRTAVDPVPQIENMRPVGKGFEDEPRTRFEPVASGQQQQGIEIALDGHSCGQFATGVLACAA